MGLFERNLNKFGQAIDIQTRADQGATFGQSNPDQTFVTKHAGVKALITTPSGGITQTSKGNQTFDSLGIAENVTHSFCFAFLAGISQEDWILFKGKRHDILSDVNHCEKDEKIQLFCRLRGEGEAAKG